MLSHSVGSQSLAFEQSYVKVVGMWTPHITPGSWDVRSLPEWKVLWQTLQAWKHQSDMVVENRVYFSGLKKKLSRYNAHRSWVITVLSGLFLDAVMTHSEQGYIALTTIDEQLIGK